MRKNNQMIETIIPQHKVLIMLYVLSYFMAMFIQVKDKNTRVTFSDWVLAFFTSLIGATLTYYAVSGWSNFGLIMTVTIVISLVSPRTFKFIMSEDTQNKFAKGIVNGLFEIIKNFINSPENKK